MSENKWSKLSENKSTAKQGIEEAVTQQQRMCYNRILSEFKEELTSMSTKKESFTLLCVKLI